MSKPHRTTGKRTPFDTPGIQIRNPLAMGTIDVVTSRERSVIQYVPAEEKEEERMPGFDPKKFCSPTKKEKFPSSAFKVRVSTKPEKKPLWYRVIQKVASVLLLLFPKDKLDESKYNKNGKT